MGTLRGHALAIALLGGILLGGVLGAAGVATWGQAQAQQPAPPAVLHPHIRRAIVELRESRRELVTAAHDFGGHRKAAVKAVDHAIEQLELALKHARRQP